MANKQPINRVVWVDRESLRSNDYNPNNVAPPELKLLALSIIEDGWTQPIVARRNGEIVDGFHRWTVSAWPRVFAITNGQVPVVFLDDAKTTADQMMSTIRHNRARGVHAVAAMADIARDLVEVHGIPTDEIERRLGMEDEELERLIDRASVAEKVDRSGHQFNTGWRPVKKFGDKEKDKL